MKKILTLLLLIFFLSGYSQDSEYTYYTGADNYVFQTKYVIDKKDNVIPVRKDTLHIDKKIHISISKQFFYINDGSFNLYKILEIKKSLDRVFYVTRDFNFRIIHIVIDNDKYLSLTKYDEKTTFEHFTAREWNIKKTN